MHDGRNHEKKTVAISVKMTPSDLALFHKAAQARWSDAELTQSALVLALARIGANAILNVMRRKGKN
jgi:hypothetical protein